MPGGAPYSLPKDCRTQQGCTWSCICEGKRELLKTGIPVRMRGHLLWAGDLSPISYHHRNFTGFLPSPVIPITMSFQTHTALGLSSGRFPQPSRGRHGAQGSAGDLLLDEGWKPGSLYSPFPFLYQLVVCKSRANGTDSFISPKALGIITGSQCVGVIQMCSGAAVPPDSILGRTNPLYPYQQHCLCSAEKGGEW